MVQSFLNPALKFAGIRIGFCLSDGKVGLFIWKLPFRHGTKCGQSKKGPECTFRALF
jgi:hypothetical protein